ncbi:hypothetical protein PCK1_001509 [Pneumocystis canis]|nr:hypothetical protein PCK1_001509 [Pneumocystis canis]
MVYRLGTLFVLRKDTEEEYAQFPITKKLNTFGRHLSCDVRLYDELISRQHARLEIDDNGNAFLENLSVNGTFVNDNELNTLENKRFQLNTGDIINLAGHKFRWEYPTNEKQTDQVIIDTPGSKIYTSKSIKQPSMFFRNEDVVNISSASGKRSSSIIKENRINEQTPIKIETPENVVNSGEIFDTINQRSQNKTLFSNKISNSKILALSIPHSLRKHNDFDNMYSTDHKKSLKDVSHASLSPIKNNVDFFPKKNINSVKENNFDYSCFIGNKTFSSTENCIIDQNHQIMDHTSEFNTKMISSVDKFSSDNLISNKSSDIKSQNSSLFIDSVLSEKNSAFFDKNSGIIRTDLNSSTTKEKQMEFEMYKRTLLYPIFPPKNLSEEKINMSSLNSSQSFQVFKLKDIIVNPLEEKSCNILPDSQPSPLKKGSPVLRLAKKCYINTRDLPPRVEKTTVKGHEYKKRPSFPPFVPSKVLNNPAITNIQFRRSMSDPFLPSSIYITKVKSAVKNQKKVDLPVTPPEFLEVLSDAERKLLGLMPLFSSNNNFKENDRKQLRILENNMGLKKDAVCDTVLHDFSRVEQRRDRKLYNNIKSETICSEFKTFSPGKWAVTFNGKKQKLYKSPVRPATSNVLTSNISVTNIDCLNQCSSVDQLKDIDKVFSPGKWVFTAPGKKMKLYCSPDVQIRFIDKIIYDDSELKSSINISKEVLSLNNNSLNKSDICLNHFQDLSYNNYIDGDRNSSVSILSNNQEKKTDFFKNLHPEMNKSIENGMGFLETIIDNVHDKDVLNNLTSAKKLCTNEDTDINESNTTLIVSKSINFNLGIINDQLFNFAKLSGSTTIGLESTLGSVQKLSNKYDFNDMFSESFKHFIFRDAEIFRYFPQNNIQGSQFRNKKLIIQIPNDNQYSLVNDNSLYNYGRFHNIRNINISLAEFDNIKNNNFLNLSDLFVYDKKNENTAVISLSTNISDLQSRHKYIVKNKNTCNEGIQLIKGNTLFFQKDESLSSGKHINSFKDIDVKSISFSDNASKKSNIDSLLMKESDKSFSDVNRVLESNLFLFQFDQSSQFMDINSLSVKIENDTIDKKISSLHIQKRSAENNSFNLIAEGNGLSIRKKNIKQKSIIEKSSKKIQEIKPIRISNRIRERIAKANNENINNKHLFKSCIVEAGISQEKVYHTRRVTRSSEKMNDISNNNNNQLIEKVKSSKRAGKKTLIDSDFFIDISKKSEPNSLKECTRITRSRRLLKDNIGGSKMQFDTKNPVNVGNLLYKIDVSEKDDINKIITDTFIKQNKKSLKKHDIDQVTSDIKEKSFKPHNVLSTNNKSIKSSQRVRSLRNNSK